MPNVVKCTFVGCHSFVDNNNKDISLFKYPITDAKRCEQWVKASKNPEMLELFAKNIQKLGNKKVCEKHFNSNDITVHQLRKLLDQNSVPINNQINNKSFDYFCESRAQQSVNKVVINSQKTFNKRFNNSLEIIEINDKKCKKSKKTSDPYNKYNNKYNNLQIIEINEKIIDKNEYMFGNDLFKWKLDLTESMNTSNGQHISHFNNNNIVYNESESQSNTSSAYESIFADKSLGKEDSDKTLFNINLDIKQYSSETKGCILSTNAKKELMIERKAHKQAERLYECNICGTRYRFESSLTKHKRESHKETETPFKLIHLCDKCDHKFCYETNLKSHKKVFHEYEN